MKKIFAWLILILVCGLMLSGVAFASHAHKGHQEKPVGVFEHKVIDNGIRAEFQIMSLASMNMKDPKGATHHVMVNLFHDSTNHPIKDAVGKVKVIMPDKKEQINTLKNYNGIFSANFTFSENGKYGVICLVKVDGEKHIFKFWYPHG